MKRKKKTKVKHNYTLELLTMGYLLISLACFFSGLINANSAPYSGNHDCHAKWSKIEYIFPAFRFGCYMNKEN